MQALYVLLLMSPVVYGFFGSRIIPDVVCGFPMPEPAPISRINPNILVYTRDRSLSFRIKNLTDVDGQVTELESKGYFKPGQQVVFIVHGFWNNELFTWQYNLKNALLKAEESTILIVTWGYGSLTLSYPQAGANTRTVATAVAALADSIAKISTFKRSSDSVYLYCIGHSLGAQVCGQAGRISGKFNRVTGLDPAGPGFEKCWEQYKVNTSSATCVDHIHTDGSGKGHLSPIVPYYGTLNQWGHIDFYPNGGEAQTGCNIFTNDASCSHMKAIDYFIHSFGDPKSCLAKHTCITTRTPESCKEGNAGQQMGYYSTCHRGSQAVQPGLFYLTTNGRSPYC